MHRYCRIICIVVSLVPPLGISAQEFAGEPVIASAAVALKSALQIQAPHLTILSADVQPGARGRLRQPWLSVRVLAFLR
jgi:hypothetical protein